MKPYLKTLSVLFLTAVLLTGCDWFDDVDNVTFQVVLPVSYEISESTPSDEPVTYSKTKILNALDNAEIEKYKNKISEIKLNKITYVIENYDGAEGVTFTDGSLKASGKTLATVASIDLENTPETELTAINSASLTEFANQIKNDKEVEVEMGGTISSTPVYFKITAYFHVTVQAEVLD